MVEGSLSLSMPRCYGSSEQFCNVFIGNIAILINLAILLVV